MHATISERLVARLRARSLDRELAEGVRPEECASLLLHAQSITGARAREELARQLRRIVGEATEPRMPGARIRPCRSAVSETADELRLLASRLQAPRPVAARGVAQARELLTDGRGPLYDPRHAEELRSAVRDAVTALDRAA